MTSKSQFLPLSSLTFGSFAKAIDIDDILLALGILSFSNNPFSKDSIGDYDYSSTDLDPDFLQDYAHSFPLNKVAAYLDDKARIHMDLSLAGYGSEDAATVTLRETAAKETLEIHCQNCPSGSVCAHAPVALLLCSYALKDMPFIYDSIKGIKSSFEMVLKEQGQKIQEQLKDYEIPTSLSFVGISILGDIAQALHNKPAEWTPKGQRIKNYRADILDTAVYKIISNKNFLWPEPFRPQRDSKSTHSETAEIMRVAGLFRYHFSDGRSVSSHEIIWHPLSKLIPPALLPNLDDSRQSSFDSGPLKSFTSITSRYFSYGYERLYTERIMQGLLRRILTNHAHAKNTFNFFIQNSTDPSYLLPVKQILETPTKAFQWTVASEGNPLISKLTLQGLHPTAQWIDVGTVAFDTKNLCLCPLSADISLSHAHFIFGRFDRVDTISDSQDIKDQKSLGALRVYNQTVLDLGVSELRALGYHINFEKGQYVLSETQYESQIHLLGSGRFHICHRPLTGPLEHLSLIGFSKDLAVLLSICTGGLPNFLNANPRDIAVQSTAKREWDLKILKHMGIFQYLLLELCSYALEGQLTDGRCPKKKESVWDLLQDKIAAILSADAKLSLPENIPLKDLCSTKVINYFKDFSNWFLQRIDYKTSCYTSEGEIKISGLYRRELSLFFTLLKEKVNTSDIQDLFKPRTEIMAKIFSEESGIVKTNSKVVVSSIDHTDILTDLILHDQPLLQKNYSCLTVPTAKGTPPSLWAALPILKPLTEKGFVFYVNGAPLENLKDGEFHVEFLMQDSSSSKVHFGNLEWFDLNPKVFLKGQELSSLNGLQMSNNGVIEYQGKLYLVPRKQIPSLKRLESFWLRIQNANKKIAISGFSDKVLSVPRSQILELLALRASGYPVQGGPEWQEVCAFYDQLGDAREKLQLPSSIQAELKPYQIEGVQWLIDLHSLRLGALLGDDMGLGKTLQTLSFLEILRTKKKLGPTLIVVPPSLVYNWKSEIEKFVPQLQHRFLPNKTKILQYQADQKNAHSNFESPVVYITTYGLLAENEAVFSSLNWHLLIFDEAQNLKNITTKRTSAARSLNAKFKLCITGTPMENHLGEFYSLMDLIVPGCLGNADSFRKTYVAPNSVSNEDIQYLKLKTKPLVLRRTKKEILTQLPDKTESKIIVAFEAKQKQIYRDVAIAFNEKIQAAIADIGESKVQLQMLTALLRLRQICSDPSALPNITYNKIPPKFEALVDSVAEIVDANESALVFTQFLTSLHRTEKMLSEKNIQVFTLHGGLSISQKQQVLSAFEKYPSGSVLIMTLKTGGVGLNLTKASYVFHLEPWWNPSAENQATDRAHRLGQKKSVQVYRYIMHDSVEEKIELLKTRKASQFQALFSDTEDASDTSSNPTLVAEATVDERKRAIKGKGTSKKRDEGKDKGKLDGHSREANSGNKLTKEDFELLLSIK